MKLHRIEGRPEWDGVNAAARNRWQIVAARSYGILTVGNLLTVGGLLIALYGIGAVLRHDYWLGFWAILAGRLLDIADGYGADLTGTKSPTGELLDATSDKVVTALMLAALWVTGVAPGFVILAVLLPHLAIAVLSLLRLRQGRRLHPSRLGKLSMASAWVGLIGLLLAKALGPPGGSPLSIAAYTVFAASVVLGIGALVGYTLARAN